MVICLSEEVGTESEEAQGESWNNHVSGSTRTALRSRWARSSWAVVGSWGRNDYSSGGCWGTSRSDRLGVVAVDRSDNRDIAWRLG